MSAFRFGTCSINGHGCKSNPKSIKSEKDIHHHRLCRLHAAARHHAGARAKLRIRCSLRHHLLSWRYQPIQAVQELTPRRRLRLPVQHLAPMGRQGQLPVRESLRLRRRLQQHAESQLHVAYHGIFGGGRTQLLETV